MWVGEIGTELLIIRIRAVILTTSTLKFTDNQPENVLKLEYHIYCTTSHPAKSVDYLQITGTDARILHCNVSHIVSEPEDV